MKGNIFGYNYAAMWKNRINLLLLEIGILVYPLILKKVSLIDSIKVLGPENSVGETAVDAVYRERI